MAFLGWCFRLVTVWKMPILVHWSTLARPAIFLTYWAIEASLSNGPYVDLARLWWSTKLLLMVEVLLNVSILVHELSHAFVTKVLGKEIRSIVLHGLGGLCIFKDPDPFHNSAWRQLLVFGAGPASNLCLAGVALLLILSRRETHLFLREAHLLYLALDCTLFLNLMLATLNLVPIFPLDGSRLLESLLKICGLSSQRASTSVYAVSVLLAPFMCHRAVSNQDFICAFLLILLLALSAVLLWIGSEEDKPSTAGVQDP